MALTHLRTRRIDLEHEKGEWIEIRMPSLAILDAAKEAHSRRAIALMAGMDLSQLKNLTSEQPGQERAVGADYDWQTLLSACIVAWSYQDKVTPENVAELDQVTVAALVSELLPQEAEADRKNG